MEYYRNDYLKHIENNYASNVVCIEEIGINEKQLFAWALLKEANLNDINLKIYEWKSAFGNLGYTENGDKIIKNNFSINDDKYFFDILQCESMELLLKLINNKFFNTHIAFDFCQPILTIGFRDMRINTTYFMPMPETTMYKNYCFVFWQDDIGFAGQFRIIHTIPEAPCKKSFT
jgi:hypothetical protein